ncbi:MAG TPA: hypothetical protein PKD55_05840 [Bellilinea sp.]|nr:hypothetical protein [Bellilinea sp.]
MAKYTGKDLAVDIGATSIPAGHMRSVTVTDALRTADATGAGSTHGEELGSLTDTDVTFEVIDDTTLATIYDLFEPSATEVSVTIYPQGKTQGKPSRTCATFLMKNRSLPVTYNDTAVFTAGGRANGGLTDGTVP